MSDPLETLRSATSPIAADPELLHRVRQDLLATIEKSTATKSVTPKRSHRGWAIGLVAALIVTASTAAWAIVGNSSSTTAVSCPTGIMDAVTGDPVADCSNEWRRRNTTEPPAMTAYDNGSGGVVVLLASEDTPSGHTALPPGPFQNAAVIELNAALADYGAGLASGCYNEAAGRDLVQAELDRLDLSHWVITASATRAPDGEGLCAYFYIEPSANEVQLIGFTSEIELDPYVGFAAALDQKLATDCLPLEAAADLVRSLAANTNIVVNDTVIDFTEEADVLAITSVIDPTATCTRSDVVVGGRVDVTLRGPAK